MVAQELPRVDGLPLVVESDGGQLVPAEAARCGGAMVHRQMMPDGRDEVYRPNVSFRVSAGLVSCRRIGRFLRVRAEPDEREAARRPTGR